MLQVLEQLAEVKSRFGQWAIVLRDTTEIEASADPAALNSTSSYEVSRSGCRPAIRLRPPTGSLRSISIAPLSWPWRCREEDSASVGASVLTTGCVNFSRAGRFDPAPSALEMGPYWLALERA